MQAETTAVVPSSRAVRERVTWIDTARGWCIVLVVMMHSALGVGFALGDQGWLHAAVAFAKPFRMPDFFLVAGLFAASTIDGPLRRFVDRKIIHFAYFYALWLFVALAVKAQQLGIAEPRAFAMEYAWRLVQPFSSTWFIQVLPILYVATRLVRKLPLKVVLPIALVLHFIAAAYPVGGAYAMESEATGWTTLDGFMLFWIYFVLGVRFRQWAFALAEAARNAPLAAAGLLIAWGAFEALATSRDWPQIFGLDLGFGLLGAGAVIVTSALVSRLRAMAWLGYLGRHSLIIYLAFFLPMAATRALLLKIAPHLDVGLMSLIVTAAAIAGPLALERVLRATPLAFLFQRPQWARMGETASNAEQPAHRPDRVAAQSA
jgi:uncharacterized membrane protein YcfT